MGTPPALPKPGVVKSLIFIEKKNFNDSKYKQMIKCPARRDDKTAGHA